ncbi:protein qui-1 [Cloeon dipterum]|uniref:protein qui-1 n=1 Tax=Cloeon dipterum TaxID=197152 RepID=UPI0032203BB5
MELAQKILNGEQNEAPPWPVPLILKAFISSTGADFEEERRNLLEQIGPEIQSEFDSVGLEVQLVDTFYCSETASDPWSCQQFLDEVSRCSRVSRGCFFIVLVGETLGELMVPTRLAADEFEAVCAAAGDDNLLSWCYARDDTAAGEFVLQQPQSRQEVHEWIERDLPKLRQLFKKAAARLPPGNKGPGRLPDLITRTLVEAQLQHALVESPNGANIIAVLRKWDNLKESSSKRSELYKDFDVATCDRLNVIREFIEANLPAENVFKISAPWCSRGADPDDEPFEKYLNQFRDSLTARLQELVSCDLDNQPDPLNGRSKATQDVLHEASCHLSIWRQHLDQLEADHASEMRESGLLAQIKGNFEAALRERHGPLLLHGSLGSGKSCVLSFVTQEARGWFHGRPLARIIRFSGATPRSAYGLELLRNVCQHLSLILGVDTIPKDCSFDPLYVNNWFGTLVRRAGEAWQDGGSTILFVIDDLHRLQPLDSDIVAPLSWLPVSLPPGVLVLAATSTHPELLKFTPLQKERLRAADCYLSLTNEPSFLATALNGSDNIEQAVSKVFEEAENVLGRAIIERFSSLLACSEFGLTEMELLELMLPASHANGTPALMEEGHCNFASLCALRSILGLLLREIYLSGKLLLRWRHVSMAEVARTRYISSNEKAKSTHMELANLFFSEFQQEESQKSQSEGGDKEQTLQRVGEDVTYSARHVEEAWLHLLKAGDPERLKKLTVCNFDFLLAAVQTVSVSYLRCVLEHVRCYLLDSHLELVYYTIRKSCDTITRDPLQLAAQIISWLANERHGTLIKSLVTSAMAWCDGFSEPLLVPLTGWLQAPLPSQIKSVTVPTGVKLAQPSATGQHVVLVGPNSCEAQLWHVMSGTLVYTFTGHKGPIHCIAMTAQELLTGGEDLSVVVWDLKSKTQRLKITEHIAPILSIAATASLVASSGEDSTVIVCQMSNGEVKGRIDHHRGPVSSLAITASGDVLISGSTDATICLWSLDDLTLLNSVSLVSPVKMISVSPDSVFLLAACDNNQLYLHALATGSEVHCLRGHKADVQSISVARDNCRAIVGGSDGRVYSFDMKSGRLIRILAGHGAAVTSLCTSKDDNFLSSAGGNKITFWSFRPEDEFHTELAAKASSKKQEHTAAIMCAAISRDGVLAVTGSQDYSVNVWQLISHDLQCTLHGHTAPITCVAVSPNGLFAVSGAEDHTCRVWGLTVSVAVCCFLGHQGIISDMAVASDSRRVVSSDRHGLMFVWLADSGQVMQKFSILGQHLSISNSMKHVVCSSPGENCLRIWTMGREDERYTVSHSEEITCFALTNDSQHVITGSKDMSLKVWQLAGGKLAQVLVGHTDHVTCIAANKDLVVSGSRDANLIVWDIKTGSDLHTLTSHLSYVTCVQISADGTLAVSGSEDRSLVVWDLMLGRARCTLSLNLPVVALYMSCDAARIVVQLLDCSRLPIVCLHNTPAAFVPPVNYTPAKEPEDLRPASGAVPKRPMRRLLKKEVSLDTYTWQKKYGHLTSKAMFAAIDERLKRRFSVSASMEEIPQTVGPEQAALAQSQHFEDLEALWNKKSPPRRRQMVKQNSLISRRESSDGGMSDERE